MDISTGKFTALTAGHYTVTYSGATLMGAGGKVWFWLVKNGGSAGSPGWWYSTSGSNSGGNYGQGSRTVVSL